MLLSQGLSRTLARRQCASLPARIEAGKLGHSTCRHPRHSRRQLLRSLLLLGSSSRIATATNPASASATFAEPAVKESPQVTSPPTYVTATGRIVAVGDLHGDWNKAIDSLKAARVISITDEDEVVWTGGDTVVVQLGDVLDRGNHEIAIVKLLRALDQQAREHGGAVYMLNGNHESLNICGDFRYVTPGAFVESAVFAGLSEGDLKDWESVARVRYAVYKPGGPMAIELAKNPTVLIVNDTAFAHGGLLPLHVNYGLEKLNTEVAAWMRADKTLEGGKAAPPFLAMGALNQALSKVNAKRLIVGHTPQLGGANCECDGKVWRIDVGMSYGVLNRPVQILEIVKNSEGEAIVQVLPDDNQLYFDEDAAAEL